MGERGERGWVRGGGRGWGVGERAVLGHTWHRAQELLNSPMLLMLVGTRC
jgi:hypothetical protein